MATYAEKLKDVRWQKRRVKILVRDDFTCIRCKIPQKFVHVHHKAYIWGRDPWEYEDDNFETLCESCHSKEHKKAEEPKIIKQVVQEIVYREPATIPEIIDAHLRNLSELLKADPPEEELMRLLKSMQKTQELRKRFKQTHFYGEKILRYG